MRNTLFSSISKSAFLLTLMVATTRVVPAQAMASAQRGAEITPFAQTVVLNPDWGPTANVGYTVGVDYTRFIRSVVQPSLEMRMTSANGTTVSERSYTGGLKLQTTIHGIRPYATFLAGTGNIYFTDPIGSYSSDNSFIYSLGGGAAFTVHSQWDLRLDFTHQQWNIDPWTLTPTTLGVGIAYRIPFHNGRVQ